MIGLTRLLSACKIYLNVSFGSIKNGLIVPHTALRSSDKLFSSVFTPPDFKTTKSNAVPLPNFFENNSDLNKGEKQILYQVLAEIVDDIGNFPFVKEATLANERAKKVATYMLPVGQVGATVFLAADRFYKKQRLADSKLFENENEHFRLTCVLCWTLHMYQVFASMQDDILDGNNTRNNLKCWHVLHGNKSFALRDTELIKDLIFIILKKYFKSTDFYIDLLELMHECMYCVYIGLSQIDISQPSKNINKPYPAESLVPGKTYSFCIFVYKALAAAMMMNGVRASDINCSFRKICSDMSLIMALSEDYIDCFADEKVNEREATDIPEGKNTWPYWKALELSSPAQAKLLMDSYGRHDIACVETVRSIYKDLNIQQIMTNKFQLLENNLEANIFSYKPKHPILPWPVILNLMHYFRQVRLGMASRP